MPKYTVIDPLEHDQKPYAPGAVVELPEEQAGPLLAAKVIEAAPEKTEKKGKGE